MKPEAIARILDANLNRSREGLRVIEDWFRFALEDPAQASQCKDMRQQLGQWHSERLHQARDTPHDVGTLLSHPQETTRLDDQAVLRANFGRVQEALRVLEEYAKLEQPEFSALCKAMRYQVYGLETTALNLDLRQRLHQSPLYLITLPGPRWLEAVAQALQGGVKIVQYRHKTADYRTLRDEAKHLQQLCNRHGAVLIINDRVDLALDIGADGVHLGQTDMPVAVARQLLGSHKLIGQSTTNERELTAALQSPVDYIGVGPVYETPTKPGKAAAGFDYVKLAAQTAKIPWFAIGGIEAETLAPVLAAGATQVAVVRALMTAADPQQVARTMLNQLEASQSR